MELSGSIQVWVDSDNKMMLVDRTMPYHGAESLGYVYNHQQHGGKMIGVFTAEVLRIKDVG